MRGAILRPAHDKSLSQRTEVLDDRIGDNNSKTIDQSVTESQEHTSNASNDVVGTRGLEPEVAEEAENKRVRKVPAYLTDYVTQIILPTILAQLQ